MLKPVESKHKIEQNNTISGFCKTWVWCPGYRRGNLQWTSLCICLSKLPHSIFLIPRTLRVHSVLSWWVSYKKAWSSHRLEVRAISNICLFDACFCFSLNIPSPQGTFVIWTKDELPEVGHKCTLSAPQSFATQGCKCRIWLLWHTLPGSHRILEYLYLFYNLIVYL